MHRTIWGSYQEFTDLINGPPGVHILDTFSCGSPNKCKGCSSRCRHPDSDNHRFDGDQSEDEGLLCWDIRTSDTVWEIKETYMANEQTLLAKEWGVRADIAREAVSTVLRYGRASTQTMSLAIREWTSYCSWCHQYEYLSGTSLRYTEDTSGNPIFENLLSTC